MMNRSLIHTCTISILFLGLLPGTAGAQVIISEIAWMGNEVSPNYEWIELTNRGADQIDLFGWRIEASDGSPNISLSGLLPGNTSVVLERTSDNSVAGEAFLVYTGALSNSGEDLFIYDTNNTVIDRVGASDGWQAGDNDTKETMQRNPDSNGWYSATGTPGIHATIPPNDEVDKKTEDSDTQTASEDATISGAYNETPIIGEVKIPTSVFAAANFYITPHLQRGGNNLEYGNFRINFGDGSYHDSGNTLKNISHSYMHPGEYTVFYELRSNPWAPEPIYAGQQVITVKNADIQMTIADTGQLVLSSSEYVDMSGWTLTWNEAVISTLPPLSILKQNTISTEPPRSIHSVNSVTLHDRDGIQRASTTNNTEMMPYVLKSSPRPPQQKTTEATSRVAEHQAVNRSESDIEIFPRSQLSASPILAAPRADQETAKALHQFPWWILALFALLVSGFGLLGYLLRPKEAAEPTPDHQYRLLD